MSEARVCLLQSFRKRFQHRVAGVVAERVVDALEAVNVSQHHPQRVAVPRRPRATASTPSPRSPAGSANPSGDPCAPLLPVSGFFAASSRFRSTMRLPTPIRASISPGSNGFVR